MQTTESREPRLLDVELVPLEGTRWRTAPEDNIGYSFELRLRRGEQSGYVGRVARLPGVHSQGDTLEDVIKNTTEALQGCLESYRESGREVPLTKGDAEKTPEEQSFRVVVNA